MFLLDTNHLSLLDLDTPEALALKRRLRITPMDDVAVSIITYEEQMRGWMSYLAQAKTREQQIEAYRKLRIHIERFRKIPIVEYDEIAAIHFERLRKAGIRIGSMDLRIASIALARNAILLTRNLSDFNKVPALKAEDWSF